MAEEDEVLALSPMGDALFNDLNKPRFYAFSTGMMMGVRACIYPISLVKTRLQVAEGAQKSLASTVKEVYAIRGVSGFFRGFPTTVIGVIPSQAMYLTTVEVSKMYMAQYAPKGSEHLHSLVAGGLASFMVQSIGVPVDIISQRLMVQGDAKVSTGRDVVYKGGLDALRQILKTEGLAGMYRGYFASLTVYVPSSALWWNFYDFGKRTISPVAVSLLPTYTEAGRRQRDVFGVPMVSGLLAGTLTAVITNPLDVGKTRLQVLDWKGGRRPNVFVVLRDLVAKEGWASLTRGMSARMLNMGPTSAFMIMTYEFAKSLAREPSS